MPAPTKLHDVQSLAGRVAALSRFISKLGEKALPFYQLMKKADKFEWTEEAQDAFDRLKKTLTTPPVLVAPQENESLYLYVAATNRVVSTVLVVEREEEGRAHPVQRPVYYLSGANLVVVDSREVVVLRPHRTSATDQQPSPMKRCID